MSIEPKPLVRDRKDRASIIAALLAIAVALCALWFALQSQKAETETAQDKAHTAVGQAQQATAEKVDLAKQVRDSCAQGGKVADELGALCNQATQIVKGDAGPAGPQGPAGPPPSDAQVQRAVELYCSGGTCKGDGPTEAQVRAAVSTYCGANGECKGPAGVAGANGEDGAPGATGAQGPQGPQGPGPSDSQVSEAVASYCGAHGGCQGPQGPAGPQGPKGDTPVYDPSSASCPEGYYVVTVSVTTSGGVQVECAKDNHGTL